MKRGLNCGSGQRRFTSNEEVEWVNVDVVSRPPDQVPDVVCDANEIASVFGRESFDLVVLHQVAEHFGCGEAPFKACWDVLKPDGSLFVFVPDIRALAERWLAGGISDFIYIVNLMGAFQGLESDRHRWHYTFTSLCEALRHDGEWSRIRPFDWRGVPGMDAARDWWVLAVEAVK